MEYSRGQALVVFLVTFLAVQIFWLDHTTDVRSTCPGNGHHGWCKDSSELLYCFSVVSYVFGGPLDRPKSHSIQKRTILQMCGLITLHTNRSCLEYNGYGCFCGLGNQGFKALDDVDTCCRKHDRCYGDVACFWFYPQWVGYGIQCDGSNCRCTDSMENNPCAYTTCRCDLRLAECLGEADFHSYYQRYNRQLCNYRVEDD